MRTNNVCTYALLCKYINIFLFTNIFRYFVNQLIIQLEPGMKTEIDRESPIPLHQQAEEFLRKLIDREEYKNGKLLPNEVELSKQFKISRNTLRQAINKLVFEGLLVRRKGYGTKVARKGFVGGIKNWLSFSQEMKKLGIKIKNFELFIGTRKANKEVAGFFNIEVNTRCLKLERVRGNEEYPFVYFISYFNPKIPLTGEEDFKTPLYELLENDYNIIVKTSREEICAGLAGDLIAGKLEISPNDPILIRKRFVYDINDVPVEYNIGYYRADSFTYTLEAQR